jgi:hypothetical protein
VPQGQNGLFSYEDVLLMIDTIRGETMELVELAPEQFRSEFGAGMSHGHLKAANRLKTLLDEALAEQQQREEAFEKEF